MASLDGSLLEPKGNWVGTRDWGDVEDGPKQSGETMEQSIGRQQTRNVK